MNTPTVSYTLRLPVDLRMLLKNNARHDGKTMAQMVIEACWKYLEIPNADGKKSDSFPASNRPSIEELKAICAGKIDPSMVCPKRMWSEVDAGYLQCTLSLGHKGNCVL